MTINKYIGKTKEEAIEKAKEELGEDAVIMNVKTVKPKGILGALKGESFEVTAAIEEKENYTTTMNPFKNQMKTHESINLSADEDIEIPTGNTSATATLEDEGVEKIFKVDGKKNSMGQELEKSRVTSKKTEEKVEFNTVKDEDGFVRNVEKKVDKKESFKGGLYSEEQARDKVKKPIFKQLNEEVALESVKKSKVDTTKTAVDRIVHSPKEDQAMEGRLENLTNMFENQLGGTIDADKMFYKAPTPEEVNFVKILYKTLLSNEVSEKYINQILSEVEKFIRPGISLDTILSNVYQKLILRLGTPSTINCKGKMPKVIFFIGPTGVGKTTTIAKIASKYKMEENMKVAFLTADTYRIAATEQLRVYANILDAPLSIIYSADELNNAVMQLTDYDLIFVDTAGFSHKNEAQRSDTEDLIKCLDKEYEKEVYLVLSATTKLKDLIEISDSFHKIADYKIIFTKLDETTCYGNILNVKLHSKAELAYVAYGQNVPDDFSVIDTQKIVKQLLGGK